MSDLPAFEHWVRCGSSGIDGAIRPYRPRIGMASFSRRLEGQHHPVHQKLLDFRQLSYGSEPLVRTADKSLGIRELPNELLLWFA